MVGQNAKCMGLWQEIMGAVLPWTRKQAGKTSAKGAGAGPDLKELKQPLQVRATRQGRSKAMLLEVTEMALNAFVFRTRSPVVQGEMLMLELELAGQGKQTLTGSVEWVLPATGEFSGQLNIWTSPEQKAALTQTIRVLRRY